MIDNKNEKADYFKLLGSGMFWEIYPQLTGEWEKDKDEFNIIIQHFKLRWGYYHAPDNCGYVNINEHCHWVNLKNLNNIGGLGWNLEKLKLNMIRFFLLNQNIIIIITTD